MYRLVIVIVVLALLLAFTLQNTDPVELVFWPWKLKLSKALLSLASLFCGLLIGIIISVFRRK